MLSRKPLLLLWPSCRSLAREKGQSEAKLAGWSTAMSSKNLPPVRHLPQWSRVGRLGVPCSPRRLPANRLQPLPVLPAGDRAGPRTTAGSGPVDTDARVASLQRNIEFLQYQHQETLHKLHQEVDILRRENKGDQLSNLSKSFYYFIIKLGKHIK